MANELVIHSQVRTKQDLIVTGSVDISTGLDAENINAWTALQQGGAGQTFVTDGLAIAFSVGLG